MPNGMLPGPLCFIILSKKILEKFYSNHEFAKLLVPKEAITFQNVESVILREIIYTISMIMSLFSSIRPFLILKQVKSYS